MQNCAQLISYLKEIGETIAVAETFTTGTVTHELTQHIEQNSEIFVGSVICGAEHVLTDLLEIKPEIASQISTGSKDLSDQLALHLPRLMKAGVYLAVSGRQTESDCHCFVTLLSHGVLKHKELLVELPKGNLCNEIFGFVEESLRYAKAG